MKKLKIILFSISLLGAGFIMSSCGDSTSNTEQQGAAYTSVYVCPMHCDGSGSDAVGKCPVCGMDYVKNEDHKKDGHKHE